jgi:ferritin-like metal-binding protein YciE
VTRPRKVFQIWRFEPKAVDCEATYSILAEAKDIIGNWDDPYVADSAMLSAAQRAQHYEMTRHGMLVSFSRRFGWNDCVGLLELTLEEENAWDKKFTEVATTRANRIVV